VNASDLSMLAGAILSLIFSYVPGLNNKFDELSAEYKRLVMLGLVILTAGAIYGLGCAGVSEDLGLAITCDKIGLLGLIKAILAAAVANQGTYGLTRR